MPNLKFKENYEALGNDKAAKLKLAVMLGDGEYIKELIKGGANPFTPPKTLVNGDLLPAMSLAISTSDYNAVAYFLMHAKRKFDFRQRHPSYKPTASEPMSWIQYAALFSSRKTSERIKTYQLENFPDTKYSVEINKLFTFVMPKKGLVRTNVASLLFWIFTTNHIVTNPRAIGCDKKIASDFISTWKSLASLEDLNIQFPDGSAFLISALHQLEFLMAKDNELDLTLQDHNGRTPIQNARLFFKASKNPELWEREIKPYLIFSGIEQKGAAIQHGEDILLTLKIRNTLGAHEIETFGIPDYKAMRLLVDVEYAQSMGKAAPVLFSMQRQISQQETRLARVEQNVEELKAELSQLSEVQFNKACKALDKYPFHCALFKKLHKATESLIRQKGDASLQIFPTMPSSERMFAAEVVLGIFNVGAALAPVPYLQVIPGVASAALACWNKHEAVKENKAVFSLELNSSVMATLISSRIVAECIATYGTHPVTKATVTAQNAHTAVILDLDHVTGALFGKVKKQVNNLSKHKFAEPLEAVVFMCDTSLEHLQSVREGLHTHSGSSDSPKFAQVSDSDSFGSHGGSSNGSGKHSANDQFAKIGDQAKAQAKKSLLKRMGCAIM